MPDAVYIELIDAYHWSQAEIDETDARLIDNLRTFRRAAADHEKQERKLEDMKQRLKDKSGKRG